MECFFHNLTVNINFDYDTICIFKDLVSIFIKNVFDWSVIWPFGNGCYYISFMVKNCKPCSHSIFYFSHIFCVDFMTIQFADNIFAHCIIVNGTYKCWF